MQDDLETDTSEAADPSPLTGQDVHIVFTKDGALIDGLDLIKSCTVTVEPATLAITAHHDGSPAWIDLVRAVQARTAGKVMASLTMLFSNGESRTVVIGPFHKAEMVSLSVEARKRRVEGSFVFHASACSISPKS